MSVESKIEKLKKYKNILKNYLECDPGPNKEALTDFFGSPAFYKKLRSFR